MNIELLLARADVALAECNILITRIEASYVYLLTDIELAVNLGQIEWAQRNNDVALAAL